MQIGSRIARLVAVTAATLLCAPDADAQSDDFNVVEPKKSAATQTRNELIIGTGWQSTGSYMFGRYTGQVHPGFYGLGGFSLHGGDAWDSGGTFTWDATGIDLGLPSRSFDLRTGQQGSWGIRLWYDGIPYYGYQNFQSIWLRSSSGALISGVTPGSVSDATTLTGRLGSYDLSTQRNVFGASGKVMLNDFWTLSTSFRHETIQGYKQNSLTFSTGSPITPTTSGVPITNGAIGYFAQPINYETNRYDVKAEYADERLQALLGYTYMSFDNTNSIWSGVNPYAFIDGYGGSPGNVSAAYSLPPSNQAQYIRTQIAYRLTPTTRINLNSQFGLEAQNSSYPAMSGNANLMSLSLPRSSLDGQVQTAFINGAITSAPMPGLDMRLAYTLDNRIDNSPRNAYTTYVTDSTAISTYWNTPLTYRKNSVTADASYRVLPKTKLSVSYGYTDTYRTYSDTRHVTQNQISTKVASTFTDSLNGSLSYLYAYRRASDYNANNADYALTGSPMFGEFYGFQRYYLASRQRNQVKGAMNLMPQGSVTASFAVKYTDDFYPDSSLGLRSNTSLSLGPDIDWDIAAGLHLHAYYTYQRLFFDQNSVFWGMGLCNGNGYTLTASCNGQWNNRTTDNEHTAGLNLDWVPAPDWKFSAEYAFSYGATGYAMVDGGVYALGTPAPATLATSSMSNTVSMLNSITVSGEYKITDNTSLKAAYTFERFTYKDPIWDATATQFSNATLSGALRDTYSMHVISLALRLRW